MEEKPKIHKLNMFFENGKEKITEIQFRRRYTRKQIKVLSQKIIDNLDKKGLKGKVKVNINYPKNKLNWTSMGGEWTFIDEEIDLFTPSEYFSGKTTSRDKYILDNYEEPEYYEGFYIFIQKYKDKGGCLKNNPINDCLYDCLKQMVAENDFPFKSPAHLKKYLKIMRGNKVHISLIPKIEKRLGNKYKINILGCEKRISNKLAPITLNLLLRDGHYFISKKTKFNRAKGMHNIEKTPVICKIKQKNRLAKNVHILKNGVRDKMSLEEYKSIRKNPHNTDIILIQCDKEKTMEETYDDFIKKADKLKEITGGKINLYKSGNIQRAAYNLFCEFNPCLQAEEIEVNEVEILENATKGPLVFHKEYEGKAWLYDFISHYSSIMKSTTLKFPIKKGEFQCLKRKNFVNFRYGMYHCIIKKQNNSKDKLIKFNPTNWYTHIDLTVAKENGFEIEPIKQKNKYNALIYSQDKLISGKMMFGKYVDFLFPLKQQGYDIIKDPLNILWGFLCKKNTLKLFLDINDKKELKIHKEKDIDEIIPLNNDLRIIKVCDYNDYYETPFARLKPFLLAKGRQKLARMIAPHMESILRVHTDGFYSDKELNVPLGKNIGDLKLEKICDNIKILKNGKII